MRGLVYMASRAKVDVYTFQKGIQYALEKLGKSKFGFERTVVSNFKSKRHEGSGNELADYSRAPWIGADQKARGLWERWRLVLVLLQEFFLHVLQFSSFQKQKKQLLRIPVRPEERKSMKTSLCRSES